MSGLAIIQARMGSERLKGKSLLSLGDNTVIYSCFNAVLSSNCFSNIIVATTSNPEDDVLVNYLKKEKLIISEDLKKMFILDFLKYQN